MVDAFIVQATGPLVSHEISATTLILQSAFKSISRVKINGASLP